MVLAQSEGAPRAFADAFGALLGSSRHRLISQTTLEAGVDEVELERADLVVAVGAAAVEAVVGRSKRPTLAVLVSRQQFSALRGRFPAATMSAIVLDQPPRRQLRLARAVMPGVARVGVMFGPESGTLEAEFAEAATRENIQLRSHQVLRGGDVLAAAERLLDASDLLLAVPDPVATSAGSARAVLLSSYRYRRPLLAYSQAYVEAGALAAVFSSPADVAREVADWLGTQAAATLTLPPVRAPQRFGVAVNRQVARSLGIDVVDELRLTQLVAGESER